MDFVEKEFGQVVHSFYRWSSDNKKVNRFVKQKAYE